MYFNIKIIKDDKMQRIFLFHKLFELKYSIISKRDYVLHLKIIRRSSGNKL